MDKLKVAYLLGAVNRGGKELLLLNMLRNVETSSIIPLVIVRNKGILFDDYINTKHKVIIEKPLSIFDIGYFIRLFRILKGEKINIVHAQQVLDAFYAYIPCKLLKIKLILTLHGFDVSEKKRARILYRLMLKRVAKCIFVSQYQLGYFQKKYNLHTDKIKVVYNGVTFEKQTDSKSEKLINTYNIKDDSIRLCSVGNFAKGRNQLFICHFLKELKENNHKFVFFFIGKRIPTEAYRYDQCVTFCNDNNLQNDVFFLGSRDDVSSILKQMDAFIYASDHDTFSLAVVEAMATGLPVFVNDWAVMNEITHNGKYANIYKTNDISSLLTKFNSYIEHKNIEAHQAKENAILVQNIYSIENHIKQLTVLYHSLN